MSKLAYAAVIVIVLLAVGGFVAYKAIDKAVDEQKEHAQWDYKLDGQSTGSTQKTVTYQIAIKNVEKDDTEKVTVLCSSIKLKGSDGNSYSVKSSTGTSTVSIFTKDGYTGMGPGVTVDMNKTKTFTVTFQIPKDVNVSSLEISQHGSSFSRNDSLL